MVLTSTLSKASSSFAVHISTSLACWARPGWLSLRTISFATFRAGGRSLPFGLNEAHPFYSAFVLTRTRIASSVLSSELVSTKLLIMSRTCLSYVQPLAAPQDAVQVIDCALCVTVQRHFYESPTPGLLGFAIPRDRDATNF